jgi:hypothetical protein
VTPPPTPGVYKTLYVAKTGNDSSNDCRTEAAPCQTIARGISQMSKGDTLTIGDGTYAESIRSIPSGITASKQYTTIKATNDWGVTIDGRGFENSYQNGIRFLYNSWVTVRGFHIIMDQTKTLNGAVGVSNSDHIRVQRVSAGFGGSDSPSDPTVNVANFAAGPQASYVLFEESFAYGGGRYNFLAYQSYNVVFRRNVSRIDHYNGSIQCAGFANYTAKDTLFQNNIVIDSNGAGCHAKGYSATGGAPTGRLFAAFWNENKDPDAAWSETSTKETYRGNIVLNVQPLYAAMNDYAVSNVHTYSDNIIWDSTGGLYGSWIEPATPGQRDAAFLNATNMTIGKIRGSYADPASDLGALGTGYSVSSAKVTNALTNSLLFDNPSYGMADHATGNYNSYYNNGIANRGGNYKVPLAGANDRINIAADRASLKYLPRLEAGSALATAGQGGGPIGADVRYMQGATGTLWGEPGYDTKQTACLWPFPNEAVIKAKMGAYVKQANTTAPGPIGARGFATGTSMDGSPQSLTKYIWEYLGNQIPSGSLCPRIDRAQCGTAPNHRPEALGTDVRH